MEALRGAEFAFGDMEPETGLEDRAGISELGFGGEQEQRREARLHVRLEERRPADFPGLAEGEGNF